MNVNVNGKRRQEQSRQTADRKQADEPNAYSIGVSSEIEPLYRVAVQLNTLMADGIATRKLRNEKIMPA